MTYSIKINENQIKELEHLLQKNNFEKEKKGTYQLFRYKKEKCSIILYTSLKLVLQGNCEYILRIINSLIGNDFFPHYGSDETGKGDFFGPLVVASVFLNEKNYETLLEYNIIGGESKNLSSEKIKKYSKIIKDICQYEIIYITPKKYNELYSKIGNLNTLLEWAHSTAIKSLYKKVLEQKPIIIDRFTKKNSLIYKLQNLGSDIIFEEKAEKYPSVALGSILARDKQLSWFKNFEEKYNIKLPRGATNVKKQAFLIKEKYSVDFLKQICKTHFKTFEQVLSSSF